MKIKKFTCVNCGAPKVNEYKSPYIMCDYCGSFTDIDYTLGLDKWNESTVKTLNYQATKIALMNKIQAALQRGDKEQYHSLQKDFWDYYYRTFPAYLPPSIDDGYKYRDYIEVCAESSTEYGFDPKWQEYGVKQQQLQNSLTYYNDGTGNKVESTGFFRLAEFFIGMTKDGMRVFYENPKYAIMHDLIPEQVHMKMKMSMFVQVWIPYLTEAEQERFLQGSVNTAKRKYIYPKAHTKYTAKAATRIRKFSSSLNVCLAERIIKYRSSPLSQLIANSAE